MRRDRVIVIVCPAATSGTPFQRGLDQGDSRLGQAGQVRQGLVPPKSATWRR
jgi:hypothetical protein